MFFEGMTTASYLYVAEISSKEHRSLLSALGPIFVSLGVLVVYTLGFLTTWQKTALISTFFSLVTVLLIVNVSMVFIYVQFFNEIGKQVCFPYFFKCTAHIFSLLSLFSNSTLYSRLLVRLQII